MQRMQHTTYSMQHTPYCTQHAAAHIMQHAACRALPAVRGVMAERVRHPTTPGSGRVPAAYRTRRACRRGGRGRSCRAATRAGQVPGGRRGYRYFGAAKELPGVKELFEQVGPGRHTSTRPAHTPCARTRARMLCARAPPQTRASSSQGVTNGACEQSRSHTHARTLSEPAHTHTHPAVRVRISALSSMDTMFVSMVLINRVAI
jgi:hypothetical protein